MTCTTEDIPSYKDQSRAGDTYTLTSRYKDENGVLRDFTGNTFECQLRAKKTSSEVAATPTCTSTVLGEVVCTLDDTTTQTLVADNKLFSDYVYSIVTTSDTGTVETLLDVSVRFTQGATR